MMTRTLVVLAGLGAAPALQAADFDDFSDLFTAEACATAVSALSEDMQSEPLYQMNGGTCAAAAPADIDTGLAVYGDDTCLTQISFEALDTATFCAEVSDKTVFGNDPAADTATPVWRQPPWPTLDAGVLSISGNAQPYQTRRIYRSVAGCQLEMHVFKRAVGESDTKALMLMHGGSWKFRQTGAIGLFTQVSHYTDAGFTVFTPFYRLTGEGEASAACSNASGQEIVADIDAAYQWVTSNATSFGADASAIYVGGQSAGAHLAARMAVDRPETTAAAMLLYPPTDFGAFIAAFQAGDIESTEGIDALEAFLGGPLNTADLNSEVVTRNSLPTRVATSPDTYPPMYLIHGAADTLVPVSQSTRLCNAYAGDPANGPATASTAAAAPQRQSAACGDEGRIDVVKGGGHVLDFCVELGAPLSSLVDTSGLCPAGNDASQAAAESSVSAGIAWLAARDADTSEPAPDPGTGDGGNSGGQDNGTDADSDSDDDNGIGASAAISLIGLLWLARRRRP